MKNSKIIKYLVSIILLFPLTFLCLPEDNNHNDYNGYNSHNNYNDNINNVELKQSPQAAKIQAASCVINVIGENCVSQGSATCVGKDDIFYYLLTCRHIFTQNPRDAFKDMWDKRIFISVPQKSSQGIILDKVVVVPGELLFMSPQNVDLALVAVERGKLKCGLEQSYVDFHVTPPITSIVYLCSSPHGELLTFTPGSVVKYCYFLDKVQTVVSCTCSEGSSGGGLYDDNYNLIGVLSKRANFNETISFAISNIEITKWLKDINFAGRINHN